MKRKTKGTESASKSGTDPQPMDPSVREHVVGTPQPNAERPCWAIQTLNDEVWALFPETPVEYSAVNGRNTALAVTYDLTALAEDTDRIDLPVLLNLISGDIRVASIDISRDDEGHPEAVLVAMHPNPRTQDRREPFGLADALDILACPSEADITEDDGPGLREYVSGLGSPDEGDDTDGGDAVFTSADAMNGGGA